jgi:serine/threonine-protein kinase
MTAPSTRLAAALADRYRLERELGQGGMATVYLAQDLKHDRQVAIKVLKPELAAVLGADRFVQEIKTTAALQHPHILPLFDSGSADGFLYYVMPYIEGETLRTKLDREKQLGVDEAVEITTEVADALDYAHRHGVIHRDIKPENILLHDGRPMVADFGIALAVSAAAGGRMTETGLSLGTPHYMSPEQATAEKEITGRSDIYSLGCVLYEMLTGNPPHTGASAQQIIMKIVTEEAAPVTSLRKSVPPNVAAALTKALEKLPADRFDSAKAFAEALGNPGFTTATRAMGAFAPAPSRARTGVVAALAAVALVSAVLALWGWLRPAAAPRPLERQWVSLDPHSPTGMLPEYWMTSTAIAPDGSAIVWGDEGTRDLPLMIKEQSSPAGQPIPGAVGSHPFFSPDGQWIGFANQSGLHKIGRGGGAALLLSDSTAGGYQSVVASGAWLDDGSIVFPSRDNARLFRVNGDGSGQQLVLDRGRLGPGYITRLAALPDAEGVLVTTCTTLPCVIGRIWLLDLSRDSLVPLVDGASAAWYMSTGHLLFGRPDGNLFAEPLDRRHLTLTGRPVAVLGPVQTVFGVPAVAFASDGSLLYGEGGPDTVAGAAGQIVAADRGGRATILMDSVRLAGVGFASLRVSPDGLRLVLVELADAGPQIFIKQLPDGPASRLTLGGGGGRVGWSPGGQDVLFVGQRDSAFVALRRRADGTAAESVVATDRRSVWEVTVSPDGRWLVYRTDNATADRGDIMIRGLTGDTVARPLIASPAAESSPEISPDGRWLAYTSDESGRSEIYVRPFPNVTDGRWLVSEAGGTEPLWSPDGRELFYRSADQNLVAVEVETGPAFQAGRSRRLFSVADYVYDPNHTTYDIARDGRTFFFGRMPASSAASRLVLVRNWFTELRPILEGK